MQLRQLLIATDFSEASSATYAHAAALARLEGGRVTLLTVDEAPEHHHTTASWLGAYLREVESRRLRLLEVARKELGRLGVRPRVEIRTGDAAVEICAHVREQQVDLVLMGQRGLRDVKGLLLGRTVHRTIRHVEAPVLVVPAAEPDGVPRYQRLLAAADLSRASRLNLRATIELATALDARVEVMQVLRIPVMAPYPDGLHTWPLTLPEEARDELQRVLASEVRAACEPEGAERCRCSVITGLSAAEALVGAARKVEASLITIPTRGRLSAREALIGSTTESVLRLARIPVLVFPVDYLEE